MGLFRHFSRLSEFLRREDGSFTAEAVIWTPVFALLLGFLADTSLIFGKESMVLSEIQQANRSLSVGHFLTVADARTYLQNLIAPVSPNATVQMSVTNNIITTTVSLPTADLAATGLVTAFYNGTVTVRSSMMAES